MNKPLLPSGDAAGQLREAAFAMLVRDKRPAGLGDLARSKGLEFAAVRDLTATLAGPDGSIWTKPIASRVRPAFRSRSVGNLTLGGTPFRTLCAYDALGIAAALEADALVETACGQCGEPITIQIHTGVPERSGPERLWLADGREDLRGSFCAPTVWLRGATRGAAWGEARAGRGRLLDLAQGARDGGSEWAGCAEAARRLA